MVTLIGCTRYVEQGITFGLPEWRENDWRWEYFGQMVPVRDADLWQRMERVLTFHQVNCGQRRFDAGHQALAGPHEKLAEKAGKWVDGIVQGDWLEYYAPAMAAWCGIWVGTASRFWHLSARMVIGCCSSLILHRS